MTKQRGFQTDQDLHYTCAQDWEEGVALHVSDVATNTVDLAFDEADVLFIAKKPGKTGFAASLISIKTLNRTLPARVVDTGALGGDLYLDIQANQGAATGKFQFTADTSTIVFLKANDAIGSAPVSPDTDTLIPAISEEHFN